MAVTLASGLRAFCIAVSLTLATVRAADPVSPLIGATRDQVLSRYGEPKSQIEAGSRVVFFYAREKIVLRDNVVVEVESLSAEPTRRDSTGAPESSPPSAGSSTKATEQVSSTRPAMPAGGAPSASDARVEIKMVKSPSTKDGRTAASEPVPRPVVAPAPVAPQNLNVGVSPVVNSPPSVVPNVNPTQRPTVKDADTSNTAAPVAPQNLNVGVSPVVNSPPSVVPTVNPTQRPAVKDADTSNTAAPADAKNADVLVKEKTVTAPESTAPGVQTLPAEATDERFGSRLFMIFAAVVLGGIGLLYWRYRQRQFVLAATSVVNTPLAPVAPPAFTGGGFTADELSKLEWKRFEELVVAYYIKTGVVAARTKTGPDSPVHIKISWKGEPRPFAYVQCIAQPSGLVDLKPLQALVGALEADNIRRGYIVTSGKFNAPARNFAEEKHLTLLSAEVFLEKLNALPTAARTEIAQSIGA